MSEKAFRWCFIGTGTLARIVAKEITGTGRHEIVSVCSRRFEKAEEFAKEFGGKACADAGEAMEKSGRRLCCDAASAALRLREAGNRGRKAGALRETFHGQRL